jgi:hypothetical protein
MPRKRRRLTSHSLLAPAHRGDMSEVMMMMSKEFGSARRSERHAFGDFPGSFHGRTDEQP